MKFISRARINRSLNNAIDAGTFEMDFWSPEDIADNLVAYESYFEDVPVEELLPHIKDWKQSRQNAVELYKSYAVDITVPRSAVERAVRALPTIEALALIRAAYRHSGGNCSSVAEARVILQLIKANSTTWEHTEGWF